MNDMNIKNAALRELLEIFESENDLDEEELKEYDVVRDEAARIIEADEDAQEAFNQVGISMDELVHQIVKDNADPYSGVGRLIDIAVRLMKAQGSNQDAIVKCVCGICEQYLVPEEQKRKFIKSLQNL